MRTNKHLVLSINIAALMVLMDLSAINIAMPSIREYFQISVSLVSLILMASMLSATGSALIMGKLIENHRAGKVLIIAFSIFGLTSSLSALSSQLYILIFLRFLQGFAEATLYVIGPALIKKYMYQPKQQKHYGFWMTSCGLGISLGPVIGGLLIKYFAWNAVFLINIPLAILGIIFSWNLDKSLSFTKKNNTFDFKGALSSFLFLAFLIVFFNLFSSYSAKHVLTWIAALLSLFFLIVFIKIERMAKSPIIQLQYFKIINFRLANLGFFLFFFVNVGSRFLRPFFFEGAKELNSSQSGLLMMVAPTIMLIISFLINNFKRYFATKQLIIIGNSLLSISMLMFSFWTNESSLSFIIISMLILGVAMGIYYPTTTQLGMKSLPEGKHGTGSAMISISKSFGKLSGILIFGLLFQFFYQLLSGNNNIPITLNAKAIQYVFIVAFFISLINTAISFRIQNED